MAIFMKKIMAILISFLFIVGTFGITSVFGGILDAFDVEVKDFIFKQFDPEYGHIYDARSKDGSLRDAYDEHAFRLYVGIGNPKDYPQYDNDDSDNYTTEADGREYFLDDYTMSNLIVRRKVYFPEDRNWVRYLEILYNPTASPISVGVRIYSNFGSGSNTRVVKTSSGDKIPDINDYWAVSYDQLTDNGDGTHDPSLSHVWGGPGGYDRIDSLWEFSDESGYINYSWENVTVNPGQTVVLMHFGGLAFNNNDAIALAQDLYNYKDAKMKYDLQEINQIINWSPSRLAKAGNKPTLPIAQILKILKENQE